MAEITETIAYIDRMIAELEAQLDELKTTLKVLKTVYPVVGAVAAQQVHDNGAARAEPPQDNGHVERPKGNPSRRIMDALRAVDGGEKPRKTLRALASELGLSHNYVRRVLYTLREDGIVESTPMGGGSTPDVWSLTNKPLPRPWAADEGAVVT